MPHHIVIAGGGFGGLTAARMLERALPAQAARVTLISDVNFMLYTPLLPGAAAGTLEPRHVVVPLREELSSTAIVVGRVVSADPEAGTVAVEHPDGRRATIEYDQLIVALGSISRTLPVPGLAAHGLALKTLPDAIALRNHVLTTLETAETIEREEDRRAWLGYVFVGAGYAGLEGLAELQDFAATVIGSYPRCREQGMRWVLVEARDQVMPEIGSRLADVAAAELRGRGIEVRTATTLELVAADRAELSDGTVVPARTLVWTAGVRPVATAAELGLPLDDTGRITTERTLAVAGHPGVWAIGDIAGVEDPANPGRPCPPTAQHALRQGRLVARNAAAHLRGQPPARFRYKTRGTFVDMGQGDAVARVFGVRLRGPFAWWLARTYHLAAMPGAKRRLRLLLDWNVQLLFGRDGANLGEVGRARPIGGRDEEDQGASLAQ